MIRDSVEIYVDDLSIYGNTFQEDMDNLQKVLEICRESNLSLIHAKCHMLLIEGISLGYHIPLAGIKVHLAKIEVITNIPTPKTKKDGRSFLFHVAYYRRCIANFTKIVYGSVFTFLRKDVNFIWTTQCHTTLIF
jgi:hypothetical protein